MGSPFSVRSTWTSVHRTFSLTAASTKFSKRQDMGQTGGQRDRRHCIQLVKTEDRVCITRARHHHKHQPVAVWSKCFKTKTSSPCRRAQQRRQDAPSQRPSAAGRRGPPACEPDSAQMWRLCSAAALHQLLWSQLLFFIFFFLFKSVKEK